MDSFTKATVTKNNKYFFTALTEIYRLHIGKELLLPTIIILLAGGTLPAGFLSVASKDVKGGDALTAAGFGKLAGTAAVMIRQKLSQDEK